MYDLIQHLALGFSVAATPENLLYALLGCILGTAIGVLPGLGPLPTIAMLLPVTYALEPIGALIMLAGIYYGAQYGGSTAAILINLPGEPSAVVTAMDGHQMVRKGRAGAALGIAAISSFIGGTVGTLLIAAFAMPLAMMALRFGPAEYFSLMILGLIGAVVLAHGPLLKAIAMIVLGLLIGLVGMDAHSALLRYTFGRVELADGIDIVAIAMGIFGFGEIIRSLSQGSAGRASVPVSIGSIYPTRADMRLILPAVVRGTGIGTLLGILPGGGAVLASFAAYSAEKKVPLAPGEVPLGKGNIRGVAAAESANNGGAQTSFIPMLTLGIPANPILAMLMGAMLIHSIQPGPRVMTSNPELFWGLIASMWIGNLILIVLNLPLIGIWVRMLRVPYRLLFPAIVLFCAIGVFSTSNSVFSIWMVGLFGVIGYVFFKLGCEAAPLLLGVILGPMMEDNMRRALILSRGDWMTFVERPVSAGLLALAVLLLGLVLLSSVRKRPQDIPIIPS